MTDVWMVFTILAFFCAAALLVRGLGRIIADSGSELDDDSDADTDSMLEAGRRP